ncbi:acetate--CoA ligase family protein [Orrella sp. 11846]|uniref:acetate--CoA ligase family protein n=1 Tax=Orrella sp. 11846 TaxID=3409913 RepID=UPI003B591A0E
MSHALRPLLEPNSICFIGASDNPGRIGGMPIALLERYNYQGDVYPINPKYQEVFGYPCFESLEALPKTPDLAVLAIKASDVLPMLERCHAKGIPAAIVYAAGFAEEGEQGQKLQAELEAFAQSSGMQIAGPNCMGFANLNTQAHTAFASVFNAVPMQEGNGKVSLLTQSGNVCAAVYALVRELGLPVSQFINTGNEACVEFSQYLEYLAQDEHTQTIIGYIEQLRDGPRFMAAAKKLQDNDKVLIVLKAGTTEKGAIAVQSHTSALAGEQRVYEAVFEHYNVIQADDFAQMALLAQLADLRHRTAGKRVAVITMSGALGAILADRLTEVGLELPDLPKDVQAVLRRGIPDYGMVSNPVDVTGNVVNSPDFVHEVLTALATSDDLDAVLIYAPGYMLDRMADSIESVAKAHPRFFAAIDTGRATCRDRLRENGVAVFDDLGRAVNALGPFLNWQNNRQQKRVQSDIVTTVVSPTPAIPVEWNEATAMEYLAAFSVSTPAKHIAQSVDEALLHAQQAQYPVVLKILSADIAHKTEVGGVKLNIQAPEDLRTAYDEMLATVKTRAPHAHLEGVLVQHQESEGVDLIIGARRDALFGPMITVGLGGVLTEIYKDTAISLLPITQPQARDMLERLIAFPLLNGYRGAAITDIDAAAQTICQLGQALLNAPDDVTDIEINPLRINPVGQGVIALDALVISDLSSNKETNP